MKALFVSDIHIGSADDARGLAFASFLDHCLIHPPTHLFLVGDIFDLWIADRRFFVERYAPLITRVRALVATGCQVHYFEGNHDLDLDVFWTRELGVRTHARPTLFELGARRAWVEHGDQMDPEDRGYHFLRWLLRTPVVRSLGRNLPNAVVRWIGERASRASRRYTSEVKRSSDDRARALMRAHVKRLRQTETFEIFVAGHVHVAEDAAFEGTRVINLGTWLKEPLVLVLTDASADVVPLAQFIS